LIGPAWLVCLDKRQDAMVERDLPSITDGSTDDELLCPEIIDRAAATQQIIAEAELDGSFN
jgi:hypothetical protein